MTATASVWDMSEHDRRVAFARIASQGARRALGRKHEVLAIAPTIKIEVEQQIPTFPAEMPSWKRILFETAIKHKVSLAEILGPQRSRPIVAARHEAMYRMKTETLMTLQQIGRRLGRGDHSSVIHGVAKHKSRMEAKGV